MVSQTGPRVVRAISYKPRVVRAISYIYRLLSYPGKAPNENFGANKSYLGPNF